MSNIEDILFDLQKKNTALKYLQVYIFHKDIKGRFVYVNESLAESLGLQVKDILGKTVDDLFSPDQAKRYRQDDTHILTTGKPKEDIIEPMTTKQGGLRWVRTEKVPLKDEKERVVGLVGISVDLTMFKAVENQLRKSEQLYRSLFEGSRDGFVRVDKDGRFLEANKAYCDMVGYTLDELKSMSNFYQITPKKWREWEKKEIWENRLLKQGFSRLYEKEYIRKDSKIISVELQSYCIFDSKGEPDFFWGVVRDITQRKIAEKALIQQTEIIKQANDLILVTDLDGYITYVNKAEEDLLGYSRKELIGNHISFFSLKSKGGLDQKEVVRETLKKGSLKFEAVNRAKDGREVLLESRTFVVKDDKGNPQSLVGISTDITQRKKDEEVLRKNEEQFRLISEGTNDLIAITEFNMGNKFVYVNPVHKEMLGYTPDDLIGKSAFDFIHPQDKKGLFNILSKYVALKIKEIFYKEANLSESLEFRMRDKEGGWHYLQTTANVIGKNKLLYISKDVTGQKKSEQLLKENQQKLENKVKELKKAQDMLVQSEKLASLGNLVSDMAHEVNNPLMIISGRAELSLMDEIQNKELAANLKIIFEQCQRAKDIIKRLLIFSRSSKGEIRKADISEPLELVVKLLEHQLNLANIQIVRNYDALPSIEIDEKQMQEVFMNLLKNASEAMPEGGRITISTFRDNDNVIVEIADTGKGISEKDLNKIFDPFFTTKEMGTGLGLSVCYGIIKSHGGILKYQSLIGKGTKAVIRLPLKDGLKKEDEEYFGNK